MAARQLTRAWQDRQQAVVLAAMYVTVTVDTPEDGGARFRVDLPGVVWL